MKTVQELVHEALIPPQTISAIMHGNWAIRIVKTACEISLFDLLQDGPREAKAVAEALSMPVAGVILLLDALVGLKLLERADLHTVGGNSSSSSAASTSTMSTKGVSTSNTSPGNTSSGSDSTTGASETGFSPIGSSGVSPIAAAAASAQKIDQGAAGSRRLASYALTEESKIYLVKDSALYMGLYLKQNEELDKMWRSLPETVATGKPVMEVNVEQRAEEIFPQLAEAIFPLNYAIACDVVRYLKTKRDYFCEPLYVLDVACGGAPWSIPFALESNYTKVDALDFPAVLSLTKRMADVCGVGQRFRFLPGDWRQIKLDGGRYDVAILGHILHSEGAARSKELIAYCYEALQPGGALVIAEFMTNRDHTAPLFSLMFGLNMYLATTDGCVFSLEELKQICSQAGFSETIRHSGIGYDSPVLLAFK